MAKLRRTQSAECLNLQRDITDNPGAIYSHFICEKAVISMADISKTQQLRVNNLDGYSTSGKRNNLCFWVNCPFNTFNLRHVCSEIVDSVTSYFVRMNM